MYIDFSLTLRAYFRFPFDLRISTLWDASLPLWLRSPALRI